MTKSTPPGTKERRRAALTTPTDLSANATRDISAALNALLADTFALYLKTKNFHWHVSGPHFRDYHLLLDDQATQIFASTDALAERVRKIGGTSIRSIGHISRLQRLLDNDADYVDPQDMLAELRDDNQLMNQSVFSPKIIMERTDVALPCSRNYFADGNAIKPALGKKPPGRRFDTIFGIVASHGDGSPPVSHLT
jgi:starvation-inducible DNA-binding protein